MFVLLSVLSLIASSLAGTPWIPEPRGEDWWTDRHEGYKNNTLTNGQNINVLFYGDSITEGWGGAGWQTFQENYVPLGAANYGIGGDRTEHVLWRIINGEVESLSPKLCVLKIGTNNIGANSEFDIARGVSAIVDQLRARLPNMKILLLGVLPRFNAEQTMRTEEINSAISVLDNGNSVRYLNMRDAFYAGNGFFYEGLYNQDLLHLEAGGYQKWAETMQPLFLEMWGQTF